MLVLQPASGLHFPAVETLREAILNQALGGTWAGAGWAVATAELPATLSAPSLCSCRTTRRSLPQWSESGRSGGVSAMSPVARSAPLIQLGAHCLCAARVALAQHLPQGHSPSSGG